MLRVVKPTDGVSPQSYLQTLASTTLAMRSSANRWFTKVERYLLLLRFVNLVVDFT